MAVIKLRDRRVWNQAQNLAEAWLFRGHPGCEASGGASVSANNLFRLNQATVSRRCDAASRHSVSRGKIDVSRQGRLRSKDRGFRTCQQAPFSQDRGCDHSRRGVFRDGGIRRGQGHDPDRIHQPANRAVRAVRRGGRIHHRPDSARRLPAGISVGGKTYKVELIAATTRVTRIGPPTSQSN